MSFSGKGLDKKVSLCAVIVRYGFCVRMFDLCRLTTMYRTSWVSQIPTWNLREAILMAPSPLSTRIMYVITYTQTPTYIDVRRFFLQVVSLKPYIRSCQNRPILIISRSIGHHVFLFKISTFQAESN